MKQVVAAATSHQACSHFEQKLSKYHLIIPTWIFSHTTKHGQSYRSLDVFMTINRWCNAIYNLQIRGKRNTMEECNMTQQKLSERNQHTMLQTSPCFTVKMVSHMVV